MKDYYTKEEIKLALGKDADRIIALLEPKPIIDRVKSYRDACKELGVIEKAPNIIFPGDLAIGSINCIKSVMAYYKLCIIAEVLREGVILDFKNIRQPKYYPYFYVPLVGGSAFEGAYAGPVDVFTNYAASSAYSSIGSRLCLDTEEKARYFGEQFRELWKEYRFPEL